MLCCQCGTTIDTNPTSMCTQCLTARVDVTEGIATQLTVHKCRGCERYLKPGWVACDLESPELLALCLKKVRGLSKVHLVDAQWIWTEPHSMRLKIKLTIQKEVVASAVLQQAFVCEFIIRNRQCEECAKQYTDGTWRSVVQVRQRVDHKRTFYYLEQLLLKNGAHSRALSIQSFKDGMDFFFAEKNEAQRFVGFLENAVPVRAKHSKKLVSMDNHSNVTNNKYTSLMVMAPLCKDDLVVLPPKLARQLGNICPLVLIERVTSLVHLVDPVTAERQFFDTEAYTKAESEFKALMSSPQLGEYVVLGCEPVLSPAEAAGGVGGSRKGGRLALVEVARASDLGCNDVRFSCYTHLGHLIRCGDTVLGYNLAVAERGEGDASMQHVTKRRALPDVVIVRKVHGAGSKKRGWALKKLEVDETWEGKTGTGPRKEALEAEKGQGDDYEVFLQQLETDKEMRRHVNLYKDESGARRQGATAGEGPHGMDGTPDGGVAADGGGTAATDQEAGKQADETGDGDEDDDDDEAVRLEELLTGLNVNDDEAARGFKVDHEDAQFLAGKFVFSQDGDQEDGEEEEEGGGGDAGKKKGGKSFKGRSAAASAAAYLADPSPPKFTF